MWNVYMGRLQDLLGIMWRTIRGTFIQWGFLKLLCHTSIMSNTVYCLVYCLLHMMYYKLHCNYILYAIRCVASILSISICRSDVWRYFNKYDEMGGKELSAQCCIQFLGQEYPPLAVLLGTIGLYVCRYTIVQSVPSFVPCQCVCISCT